MGSEEKTKQTILQKIFDKNPLLEFVDKRLLAPTPDFDQVYKLDVATRVGGKAHFDPESMEKRTGLNALQREFWLFDKRPAIGWGGPIPFTDEIAMPWNDMAWHACQKIEQSALECLEFYGYNRGKKICSDYYDDFVECTKGQKQRLRMAAMMSQRRIRYREYLAGKRDWDSVYIQPPPIGVYWDPCPNPLDNRETILQ